MVGQGLSDTPRSLPAHPRSSCLRPRDRGLCRVRTTAGLWATEAFREGVQGLGPSPAPPPQKHRQVLLSGLPTLACHVGQET